MSTISIIRNNPNGTSKVIYQVVGVQVSTPFTFTFTDYPDVNSTGTGNYTYSIRADVDAYDTINYINTSISAVSIKR